MSNQLPSIQQLTPNTQLENYPLLIKSVKPAITKTNKPYLSFVFADKTVEIVANLWDTPASAIANYPTGRVILINGVTVTYQERIDIQIHQLALLDPKHEYANPMLYVKSAPLSRSKLEPAIESTIQQLNDSNPLLYQLVGSLYANKRDDFYEMPATVNSHHALFGGLAYHTAFLIQLAKNLSPLYKNVRYDVLYASIMLQSLNEVERLAKPTAPELSKFGQLISTQDGGIIEAATRLNIPMDDESLLLVRHTLQSFSNEEMSPITREAIFLQHLKQMDADMFELDCALADTPFGTFSKPSPFFGNKSLYQS